MGQGFKIISVYFSLWLMIWTTGCGGEEHRYYLSYNEEKRVYENEVDKSQTKGVKHYMVHLMDGEYHHIHLVSGGKVMKKFVYMKGSSGKNEQVKRLNEKDQVYQIDYLYPNGEIKKTAYLNDKGKILGWDEFDPVSDDMMEGVSGHENVRSLKYSSVSFKEEGSDTLKEVIRYQYFIKDKKLRQVIVSKESYKGKTQVKKELFKYGQDGLLYSRKEYNGEKLVRIYYYDEEELLEEEHLLSDTGKVKSKIYWDKSGKEIKRIDLIK